jgi:Uma2 family endonuclease
LAKVTIANHSATIGPCLATIFSITACEVSTIMTITTIFPRHGATWQDYLFLRDGDWRKIVFNQGWLWCDREPEGPGASCCRDLVTMVIAAWGMLHPGVSIDSLGGCLLEKPETQASTPDLVIYRGDIPQWQPEVRWIDLSRHRVPDLVGEIFDTTLNLDLDEQKQLYASLGIGEYWVIDVKGLRVFAFGLTNAGVYEIIETSQVLEGLSIALLEQTLDRLSTETNTAAANWLMQQLRSGD